jgi:hypothetical protein
MPVLSITFSDAAVAEMADALASQFHYQTMVPDPLGGGGYVPNPESKVQFGRRMVLQILIGRIRDYRRTLADETAAATPDPDIT